MLVDQQPNRGVYRRTPAAFPRKSSPPRMYRESMASEACPVCCLILDVETPTRGLCPEYPVMSNPGAAIRSRTIKKVASPDSRRADRRPCRSTGWKTGPS
jgi:hypothetical protein